MNLLMLTSHFPPSWGGTESQNLDVAKFFVNRGHQVEVLNVAFTDVPPEWKDRMAEEDIQVTYLKNSQLHLWDHFSLIKQFVSTGVKIVKKLDGPVIIEAHEMESALAALLIKRKTRRGASVWFLHGPDIFCCKNLPVLSDKKFCKGVGKSIQDFQKCVSCLEYHGKSRSNIPMQYISNILLDKWLDAFISKKQYFIDAAIENGFHSDKTKLVPYWINVKQFKTKSAASHPEFKERIIVMNIGAFIPPWKGFEYFIDAARLIVKTHPEVLFVNVGGIDRTSVFREYVNHLLRKIKRNEISENFLFIPSVPRNEVVKWINSADIMAFTSFYDNYHWSLIESFACSKPCVVTDAGPTREMAVDGVNSLVAQKCNVKDIAEKICRLIDDPELRGKIGNGARVTAKEHDRSVILPQLESYYKKMVFSKN